MHRRAHTFWYGLCNNINGPNLKLYINNNDKGKITNILYSLFYYYFIFYIIAKPVIKLNSGMN